MARAHIHIRNYVSSVLRDQASAWRGKQQGDDATARVSRSIQKGLQDAGDVSRREIRVGQLAQAEQRDTHLVVLFKGQLGGVGEPIFGRRFLSSRNSSNLVNYFARLNNNNENKGLYLSTCIFAQRIAQDGHEAILPSAGVGA